MANRVGNIKGPPGDSGAIPGGAQGEVLAKRSDNDGETTWKKVDAASVTGAIFRSANAFVGDSFNTLILPGSYRTLTPINDGPPTDKTTITFVGTDAGDSVKSSVTQVVFADDGSGAWYRHGASNPMVWTAWTPLGGSSDGPDYLGTFRTSDDAEGGSTGQVHIGKLDDYFVVDHPDWVAGRSAEQFIHFTDKSRSDIWMQLGYNGGGQFELGFHDPNYAGADGRSYRLAWVTGADGSTAFWEQLSALFGLTIRDGIFDNRSRSGLVLDQVEISEGPSNLAHRHVSYVIGGIPAAAASGDSVYLGAWQVDFVLSEVLILDVVNTSLATDSHRFEFAFGSGGNNTDGRWRWVDPVLESGDLNPAKLRLEFRYGVTNSVGVLEMRLRFTQGLVSSIYLVRFDSLGLLNWKRSEVSGTGTYPARGTRLPVSTTPAATVEHPDYVRRNGQPSRADFYSAHTTKLADLNNVPAEPGSYWSDSAALNPPSGAGSINKYLLSSVGAAAGGWIDTLTGYSSDLEPIQVWTRYRGSPWNKIYPSAAAATPNIKVSDTAPTAADGADGDVWIVV